MQLFSNFFCYEPDLALEVLCFARKRYAHHNRGEARKKAQRVRRFLLSTANLFQGRNAEGEPELTCFLSRLLPSAKMFHCEFPEQELARRRIKTIPVASLQDKEIAAFLFGPKCPAADLETVKEVRHSLSIKS